MRKLFLSNGTQGSREQHKTINDIGELGDKRFHQERIRLGQSVMVVWEHAEAIRLRWQLGETVAEAQSTRIVAPLQGVMQSTRNLSIELPQLK